MAPCPGREDTRPRKKRVMRLLPCKDMYIQDRCLKESHTHLPTANGRQQSKTQPPVQAWSEPSKGPRTRTPCHVPDQGPQVTGARSLSEGSSGGKKCPPAPHACLALSLNRVPEKEKEEAKKEGKKRACRDQSENKRGPIPSY